MIKIYLKKKINMQKNARFNGVGIGQKRQIEQNGHLLLVEKFIIPKTNRSALMYYYPLKKDLMIGFLVAGMKDDINTLFLKDEMPPLFADILKGTKRINQDY